MLRSTLVVALVSLVPNLALAEAIAPKVALKLLIEQSATVKVYAESTPGTLSSIGSVSTVLTGLMLGIDDQTLNSVSNQCKAVNASERSSYGEDTVCTLSIHNSDRPDLVEGTTESSATYTYKLKGKKIVGGVRANYFG